MMLNQNLLFRNNQLKNLITCQKTYIHLLSCQIRHFNLLEIGQCRSCASSHTKGFMCNRKTLNFQRYTQSFTSIGNWSVTGYHANRHFHMNCTLFKDTPVYIDGGGDDGDDMKYSEEDEAEERKLFQDKEYQRLLREYCNIPGAGHRVLVIQPVYKRFRKNEPLTTPDLQLAEACTLVETLHNWKVIQKMIVPVHHIQNEKVFRPGRMLQLTDDINGNKEVTAVFLSVNRLTVEQSRFLQDKWNVPVLDRFTVVLQIFKEHAKTNEARLQVALAEIPYIKSCITDIHEGSIDKTFGGSEYLGGDTYIQNRWSLLGKREAKLRTQLMKVKKQRALLRQGRQRREQPTVAVVGYTNCGKTTLIKALTGDLDMEPKDQLFATLDITAHGGILPNQLSILYIDTVGFISDIPIALIEAFSATLEDAVTADVIIHLQDLSHPDRAAQKANVESTLKKILSPKRFKKVINVGNKADLVRSEDLKGDSIFVSSIKQHGLHELEKAIQSALLQNKGLLEKRISIPAHGTHLKWLYAYAAVKAIEGDTKPEHFLVDIVITRSAYEKFKAAYGHPTMKKKSQDTVNAM